MAEPKVNIVIGVIDKASSAIGGIGKALGGLGTVALGAAAGGMSALVGGLGFVLSEAAGGQEVLAQLDAVLTSTGGKAGVTADMATDLATSLMGVTRFSDDAILAGENLLLTFTNIGADVFPEATETLLNMAQAMGTDVSSQAIQLGKALNDPLEGMSALTRVGVTFSDEQKKMIETMMEAGDIAGAQAIVLGELKTEFGGSAIAAGQTLAGQLDILKNQLLDTAEGFGNDLLPYATEFLGMIRDHLPAAIAWLTNVWDTMLLPALQQIGQWLGVNLPPVIAALAAYWTSTLQPALAAVWSFVQTNLIPVLQLIWQWIATNLPPALAALANFWNNTLLPALRAVWQFLSVTMMPVWKALGELIEVHIIKVFEMLVVFWEQILQPALQAIWKFLQDNIVPIFKAWYDGIGGIAGIIDIVVGKISELTEWLSSITLPDWLTPGSPTPFELGLRGIAGAMDDLNRMQMPAFNANLTAAGIAAGAAGVTNHYNLTINEAGRIVDPAASFSMMKALARAG